MVPRPVLAWSLACIHAAVLGVVWRSELLDLGWRVDVSLAEDVAVRPGDLGMLAEGAGRAGGGAVDTSGDRGAGSAAVLSFGARTCPVPSELTFVTAATGRAGFGWLALRSYGMLACWRG
jgi:hypothetical protein